MSRYYKVEDVERVLKELADEPHYQHYDDDWSMGVAIAESRIEDLPTIEVSEDCISREGTIKALRLEYPGMPLFKELRDEWQLKTEGYREAEEIIRNAPSVVPSRAEGEWEVVPMIPIDNYKCSECGAYSSLDFDYCSNCGAEMKG